MLQLKRAALSDIPFVQHLGKETYREHFSEIWSKQGIENYLDKHFSESVLTDQLQNNLIHYYTALYDHDPIGIIKIKLESKLPAKPFDLGFELEKIYLLSRYVGMGFGKKILKQVINLAKERNESFIWLNVLKSNTQTKRIYESIGFKTAGEIDFSTDIKKIDMWVMRLDLQ